MHSLIQFRNIAGLSSHNQVLSFVSFDVNEAPYAMCLLYFCFPVMDILAL
jgi:hypothetical protein